MIKQDAKDWINTLDCVLGAPIPQQLAQDVVKVQQGIRSLPVPAKDTASEQLKCLEGQMRHIARAEVERRARQILRNGLKGRNPARSFVMCRGDAFFIDRHGEPIHTEKNGKMLWAKAFYDFINEWDDFLHLTGAPMRIDHPDEVVKTDWNPIGKFSEGSRAIFRTTDSSDDIYGSAVEATVKRQLDSGEADEEVGPMYEIELATGGVRNAFEDELT